MFITAVPKKKTKGISLVVDAPTPRISVEFLRVMAARSHRHSKRDSRTAERRAMRKEHGF